MDEVSNLNKEEYNKNNKENIELVPHWWTLTKKVIGNSLAPSLFYFQFYLQFMIVIIFIGNNYHDTSMINIFGLINFIFLIIVNFPIGSFGHAFDIFGTDFYKQGELKNFGLLYLKTQFICLFSSIIFSLTVFLVIKLILKYSVETISNNNADNYTNLAMVYPILQIQNSIHFNYLNIIGKKGFIYTILVIQLILFIGFNLIFILVCNYGLVGIGLSYIISNFITYICYMLYIYVFNSYRDSLVPLDREVFTGWGFLISRTFDITSFTFIEEVGFELLTLVAFFTLSINFTIYLILYSIYQLLYAFTWGLSRTCESMTNILISNGKKQTTVHVFYICFILNSIITKIFFLVTLILLGVGISYAFIIDSYIAMLTRNAQYSLVFSLVFHSMSKIMLSFFTGIGLYTTVAYINIISLYFINIPLAIIFGICCNYGATGIFLALLIVMLINVIVCWVIYELYIDLNKVERKPFLRKIEKYIETNSEKFTEEEEFSNLIQKNEEIQSNNLNDESIEMTKKNN